MPMHPIHIWTKEHAKRLMALVENGRLTVTQQQASDIVGFPFFPLYQQLQKLGIKPRSPQYAKRFNAPDITPYIQNRKLIMAEERIGRLIGRDHNSVRRARLELGLGPYRKQFFWTEDKVRLLHTLLTPDLRLPGGIADAALRLGCKSKAVQRKLYTLRKAAKHKP